LGVPLLGVYAFIGTLFLNALKMLIVPLIMSAVITGMAGIGRHEGFGRLGLKTLAYYLLTSLLAILVGLLFVNLLQPGVGMSLGSAGISEDLQARVASRSGADIIEIFIRMVPPNIVAAAANGQMLGLIFFSLLFGYFVHRIPAEYAAAQDAFWQGVYHIMMRITDLVMRFAPIGVFGLVAGVVARTGIEQFAGVGLFFVTVVLALATHALVTLPLLLTVLGRVNPWRHFRAMAPAILTAFSTSSSAATLPITLDCVERRAGVSNRTSSFVLPLGATVNMDGTALYECVAALFIAQAYGLELSFATQFTVVVTALLTSIGVAGIPSASLVAISVILGAIGLPLEGIGLILVVDRVLDMLRTSVNVFSDSCGAVIIARSEGEDQVLARPVDEIEAARA
ncbi:MAG: dicarboxylate/amino acid:cation symporter, partial [Gammaproteobacteria bacterium]